VRRSWLGAAILLGIVAIVVAAIAMRLSDNGSSQPSAAEWADSVCSSLATWKSSIESLHDVSGGTLTADSLNAKIDDGKAATQKLIDDLKALGPPDLQAGDQAKQQLTSDLDSIQSTFDQLQGAAQQATQGGKLSLPALAQLAPQFQALLDAASNTVDDVKSANVAEQDKAELQAAFADAQSCQALQSSG